MRIGIDSYSYHRLLGETRPGEPPVAARFGGSLDAVRHARALGAEVVALETAFLPPADAIDPAAYRAAAGPAVELAVAWGHPSGLAWGADEAAAEEMLAWVPVVRALGGRLMRIVIASPRVERPADPWPAVMPVLDRALAHAARHDVTLCVENHGDVTVAELEWLLGEAPGLGVCLDTANALRMGDDPVDAARRLGDRVAMVHLKDCSAGDGGDPVAGPASVPYGTGVVDVAGVLEALGDRLEGLPVCVEVAQLPPDAGDERALVADAVDWLRTWRAGYRIKVRT